MSWAREELEALAKAGLLRVPRVVQSVPGAEVEVGGRKLVLLCSNDYLGLAGDVRVRSAAAAAARRWGAGAGASRLVSGTTGLHRDLESALASFERAQDAVLFSSGYLANIGAITTLGGGQDAVFSDELNHASIVDACRLARTKVLVYRHADTGHLESLLSSTPARRRVVVTDSVFSMDGDLAPLAELVEVCERTGAILVVDEAHATGVLGPGGAGAVEELGLLERVPVVVGTLSKALGSTGGYVATSADIAALMRNRARTHVFDTAPAPATVAAAAAALAVVRAEPHRRARVRATARLIASELHGLGYDAREPAAAIVAVHVGEAREAVELSQRLFDLGVLCPAIRPPSVPEGTSRLRVTPMATHADEHIDRALDAFARARDAGRTARREVAPRRRDVFVTGTDTGVGKTVTAAAIAYALSAHGLRVAYFKPLQTGTIDGDDDASDVRRLAGCDAFVGAALPDPLAPSVAARLSGIDISVDAIVERFRELQRSYDAVVVEGAGGLLVPIDDSTTMAGLASELGLPLAVVARPALGTLNHTALTVEAARSRGLEVLGVLICGYPAEPGPAELTNPGEIEELCGAQLLGAIPRLREIDLAQAPAWLGPLLGGSFDRETFLRSLGPRLLV